MKKFWGFYKNESFSVGCSGRTVYVYDNKGNELKKFRDFPYAYTATFKPNSNVIAVKSTEGHIGFYDLETLSLIKKDTVTRIGAQDEGFSFSTDGNYFYNIEKPISSTKTQLAIYETENFTKINTLFADDEKMVLDSIEFDPITNKCYILGFMRDCDYGVFDYGFVAILNQEKQIITDIHMINQDTYDYLEAYKHWEQCGFTEKSLNFNNIIKKNNEIKSTSIKEVHSNSTKNFYI